MSKTLVVVESPSKAKKIGQMLGENYIVQASGGHIRDLPVRPGENGYNEDTFEPVYEVTERGQESVKYLKSKLAACSEVLLATDPDREGEAIGWHVAEVLGVKKRMRVKFHEITAGAIMKAVKSPTPLDMNLVRAQEARRVIDRLVGWMVSSPLSRAINEKASAGRVQSPSLGLVVEREREIKGFTKEQFLGVKASFAPEDWSAEWVPPGNEKCKVRADADRAAAVTSFTVKEYIEKDESEAPPPPFDTALLQQAASVALKFDPENTMAVAQKLYENGHITYHRTDEANLSDDAFEMITAYSRQRDLPVVTNRRKFKTAAGAQEAHEAIRPTHFDADTSALSGDELALYQLIHRRAVASQLADVVFSVRRAKLEGEGLIFNAVGRVIKSKGWRAFGVEAEVEDEEKDEAPANTVPTLTVGQSLTTTSSRVIESWSRSPGRYTKASLIKTLKSLGIGRPATYAVAVDGLEKRAYVTLEKRQLVPTQTAEKIYDALNGKFAFIRVDFTRNFEADLDAITAGHKSYAEVVRGMHNVLKVELSEFCVAPTIPTAGNQAAITQIGEIAAKIKEDSTLFSDFESKFISEQTARIKQYREDTHWSEKQIAMIDRIHSVKVLGRVIEKLADTTAVKQLRDIEKKLLIDIGHAFSEYDTKFINDQLSRLQKDGESTTFSAKQAVLVERIFTKHVLGENQKPQTTASC